MSQRVANGTYFGQPVLVRHGAGLSLAETQYAGGTVVPQHEHESALCVLVLEGAFEERSDSQRETCAAGTLLFLPEGAAHSHKFLARRSRAFTVQFGAQWTRRMDDFGVSLPDRGEFLDRGCGSWSAARFYQTFRRDDNAIPVALDERALAILQALSRTKDSTRRETHASWLRVAREYVSEHFRDPFSLSELARLTGVHPAYLSRAFRRETGETLSAFVRRLRLEHAAQRLLRDPRPIGLIGLDAGFADHSHFTREFKRAAGITPQAYRELFSPGRAGPDLREALSP